MTSSIMHKRNAHSQLALHTHEGDPYRSTATGYESTLPHINSSVDLGPNQSSEKDMKVSNQLLMTPGPGVKFDD